MAISTFSKCHAFLSFDFDVDITLALRDIVIQELCLEIRIKIKIWTNVKLYVKCFKCWTCWNVANVYGNVNCIVKIGKLEKKHKNYTHQVECKLSVAIDC